LIPIVCRTVVGLWAAAAFGECLVVTTHGSRWQFRDDVWRYPAFQAHETFFTVLGTVPLATTLQTFPARTISPQEHIEFTFELDVPVDGALLVHLSGSTPNYDGFRASFTVTDPNQMEYRLFNHTSERTLHIDQPAQGTYTVHLFSDQEGSFTVEVGTGISPFLTLDLAAFSALFVPDLDQLTTREVEAVRAYLDIGGKLVVVSDLIRGASYSSSSNFPALNDLLSPSGIRFTGELAVSDEIVVANHQEITVFDDVVDSPLTRGVELVTSTASTLELSGGAQGLVFDANGDAVLALDQQGLGDYLVVATGIGFNSDFHLDQNDLLATRIVEWANGLSVVLYLPAAASTPGAAGTHWYTDAWIHNRAGVGVNVVGAFLDQGTDNSAALASLQPLGSIAAGGFLEIADVVSALGQPGGVGGVYLAATPLGATPTADLITASSHTWTGNPYGQGTYGQGIAAVSAGVEDELRATGLIQSSAYRTNVGVLNTSNAEITVRVRILDGSGSERADVLWDLQPYEQRQESIASLGVGQLAGGTCVLGVTSGPESFIAYASIVDNHSGDAVYVEAR
jgi:hypothetical protein